MDGAAGIDLGPLREAAARAAVGRSVDGGRGTVGHEAASGSPFRVASLTKPVTAVTVLLALRGAGLGLDVRVVDVVPGLRDAWLADSGITVEHLLSQTSGLSGTVTAADLAALGDGGTVRLDAARLVGAAGSAHPPGSRWAYDNGNYVVAGAVIEALTGGTFERTVERLVVDPWGLGRTTFAAPPDLVPGHDDGSEDRADLVGTAYPRGRRPSGGLCSTVDDLLTFGEHLLARPDLLDVIGRRRSAATDPVGYGLGWALGPSGQLHVNGRLPGYRAGMLLVPGARLAAVALAAGTASLPAVARILSDQQQDLTGDDLTAAIVSFAA